MWAAGSARGGVLLETLCILLSAMCCSWRRKFTWAIFRRFQSPAIFVPSVDHGKNLPYCGGATEEVKKFCADLISQLSKIQGKIESGESTKINRSYLNVVKLLFLSEKISAVKFWIHLRTGLRWFMCMLIKCSWDELKLHTGEGAVDWFEDFLLRCNLSFKMN